ncbi:hypothetical protein LJB42_003782 [Komagataella kurtzmanii]|nr:hypothetical protein LJB42_003782 [Komagataella kurtzmanii]
MFLRNIRRFATYHQFQNTTVPIWNNKRKLKYLGVAVAGTGIFVVSHIEEAPITKRKRLLWINPKWETIIGEQSYSQLIAENRDKILPENHPTVIRVKKIMNKIIKAGSAVAQDSQLSEDTSSLKPMANRSTTDNMNWKVHVIHDSTQPPNAFVLPGGKVFVISSILPICANDDGLATVLAHEYAHQLARHTGENLSKMPFYALLNLVLFTITGSSSLNRILLQTAVQMPASREMETEADYIGLMLMSQSCYDPQEAPRLWQRMAEHEKSGAARGMGSVPEFLSTHPASRRRIQNMNNWLPEAERLRETHCLGQVSWW